MPEVAIKYKNAKTAQSNPALPIVFAERPDVTALAGMWKNKNISLEQLRKNAWGNRI